MFSKKDLAELIPRTGKEYNVIRYNGHDVHLHSLSTGHDWIIMSNYADEQCIIMHRHSDRYPYHRQRGHYASIWDALDYIKMHDADYSSLHKSKSSRNISRGGASGTVLR